MVGSVTGSGMHCDAFKLGLLARVLYVGYCTYSQGPRSSPMSVCGIPFPCGCPARQSCPPSSRACPPSPALSQRETEGSNIANCDSYFLGCRRGETVFFPHCSQAQSEPYVKGTEYFGYRQVNKSRPQYLNPILEGKINAKTG